MGGRFPCSLDRRIESGIGAGGALLGLVWVVQALQVGNSFFLVLVEAHGASLGILSWTCFGLQALPLNPSESWACAQERVGSDLQSWKAPRSHLKAQKL